MVKTEERLYKIKESLIYYKESVETVTPTLATL